MCNCIRLQNSSKSKVPFESPSSRERERDNFKLEAILVELANQSVIIRGVPKDTLPDVVMKTHDTMEGEYLRLSISQVPCQSSKSGTTNRYNHQVVGHDFSRSQGNELTIFDRPNLPCVVSFRTYMRKPEIAFAHGDPWLGPNTIASCSRQRWNSGPIIEEHAMDIVEAITSRGVERQDHSRNCGV